MTSGKIFANGYNEIMKNAFHLLEYNASLGPQHLSNDASFVIFLRKRRRTQTYKNYCVFFPVFPTLGVQNLFFPGRYLPVNTCTAVKTGYRPKPSNPDILD